MDEGPQLQETFDTMDILKEIERTRVEAVEGVRVELNAFLPKDWFLTGLDGATFVVEGPCREDYKDQLWKLARTLSYQDLTIMRISTDLPDSVVADLWSRMDSGLAFHVRFKLVR